MSMNIFTNIDIFNLYIIQPIHVEFLIFFVPLIFPLHHHQVMFHVIFWVLQMDGMKTYTNIQMQFLTYLFHIFHNKVEYYAFFLLKHNKKVCKH